VEFATLTTAIAALAGVLALVLLAGRAARRFGLAGAAGRAGSPGRRLALVETLALDPRRRLLLIRCDGREVLVLTGGPQDLLLPISGGGAVEASVPERAAP
jgi:flagellar protein FliO/FliZ